MGRRSMRDGDRHARVTGGPADPDEGLFGLPDGTLARLYGGLGFRYWLGERGASELVAGVYQFWESVPERDRAAFVGELQREAVLRVAAEVERRTGLDIRGSNATRDRIEWLVIWGAEPDLLDRLHGFEAGLSAMRPAGTRARDLSGAQLGRLTRRLGLHGGSRRRIDANPRPSE